MSTPTRLLVLCALGLVAVFALGRCEGRVAADLDWHARNVARVTKHVRVQRAAIAAAVAAKDASGRRVALQSAAADAAQDTLADVLADAEAALRDSAATIETLRRELGRTAAAAHGLSRHLDALQAAVAADAVKHLAERAAFQRLVAAQDSLVQAQAATILALDCRILGMRCPSRKTSAGLGGLVVLALVLL